MAEPPYDPDKPLVPQFQRRFLETAQLSPAVTDSMVEARPAEVGTDELLTFHSKLIGELHNQVLWLAYEVDRLRRVGQGQQPDAGDE